jgi:hypothetical protein
MLPKLAASQKLFFKEPAMNDTQEIYYGMFTDAGNKEVAAIVEHAKAKQLTWAQTYKLLSQLAMVSDYAEAMDTMVREIVYDAIGADEDFYI